VVPGLVLSPQQKHRDANIPLNKDKKQARKKEKRESENKERKRKIEEKRREGILLKFM
jgi:hypothetical protein